MSEESINQGDAFNPYLFYEFLEKNVLGSTNYVSIRDFSHGYHLGVVRRTGIDAIEVVLSFLNGETRIVRKNLRGEEIIVVRGMILYEEYGYEISKEVRLEKLEDRFKVEILKVLGDLEYAFMGTELEF